MVFGDSQGEVLVRVESSALVPPRRRLSSDPTGAAFSSVRIAVLSETPHHANHLMKKLEASVEDGTLVTSLRAHGLNSTLSASIQESQISPAGIPPQAFPVTQTAEVPLEAVPMVECYDGHKADRERVLLLAGIFGGVMLLLLLGLLVAVLCARRPSTTTVSAFAGLTPPDPPMPCHVACQRNRIHSTPCHSCC